MRLDMMNILSAISEPSLNILLYDDLDNHATMLTRSSYWQFSKLSLNQNGLAISWRTLSLSLSLSLSVTFII